MRSSSAASSATPAPVALEVAITDTSGPRRSDQSSSASATRSGGTRSALERARTRGRRARRSSWAASSLLDRGVIGERVGLVGGVRIRGELGREVEHVHEQARALDVREEVVAEPRPVARTLDEAGDVGDHELALLSLCPEGYPAPEHRRERRERIARDLRRSAREPREQRGLAGVWQTHEADVRQQLELQPQPTLLARQTTLCEVRRLACGCGKALVAPPARATLGDHGALAGRQQIPATSAHIAVGALHLCARRDAHEERLTVGAVA